MSVVGKLAVRKPLEAHVVAILFPRKDRRSYLIHPRKGKGMELKSDSRR